MYKQKGLLHEATAALFKDSGFTGISDASMGGHYLVGQRMSPSAMSESMQTELLNLAKNCPFHY